MKKQRKPTAGQRLIAATREEAAKWRYLRNRPNALLDAARGRDIRKPNFGWPFDNVNAIVLKG